MQEITRFLRGVLPTSATYYAAVEAAPGTNDIIKQSAVRSVDELANIMLTASRNGNNAFYGVAGFAQGYHPDPDGKIDKRTNKPKQVFRTQANACAMRAFWLDLDVGEGDRKYASQRDAVQDLARFVKAVPLPMPTVINSGGGIHVYWTLTQDISAKNWNTIAALLDACVKHAALRVDPKRTMDAASILRPVETNNAKPEYGNGGKPVRFVNDLAQPSPVLLLVERLRNYMKQHSLTPTKPTSSSQLARTALPGPMQAAMQGMAMNPAFMATMGHVMSEQKDKNPKLVVQRCRQIREAGREMEPVWFAMMTVMKCCDRGRDMARVLSRIDPRYNEQQFESKFDYVESQTGGPALCSTFDRECPGKCSGCAYKGRVVSPAELGREAPLQQPESVQLNIAPSPLAAAGQQLTTLTDHNVMGAVINQQPTSVLLLKDPRFSMKEGEGLFYHFEADDEHGEPVQRTAKILEQCVYLLSAQRIEISFTHTELTYIWMVTEKNQPTRQVRMTAKDFSTPSALQAWCFNSQILVPPKWQNIRDDFMRTYLAQLQRKIPQIVMREHFGWTQNRSQEGATTTGFILGETLLAPHTPSTKVGLTAELESYATNRLVASGSLDQWKNIPAFYKKYGLLWGQLGICLAFGAPLMRFAPGVARNGIVNFWSGGAEGSGTGKTTLQMVINSVWGDPQELMLNVHSTGNSRYRMMGWLSNLPITINEATRLNMQDLSDTLFQISEGEEKDRMNKTGGLQWSGSWNTIAIMSANHSMLDKMLPMLQQRDAEVKRVLDIEVAKTPGAEADARMMERVMERHYGTAGMEFLQRVLDNDKVFRAIPQLIDHWCARHSEAQDERYWNVTIACAIIAGRFARNMGLIDFDMDEVERYALAQIRRMRSSLVGTRSEGSSLLSDFLADKLRDMLVVPTAERVGAIDKDMPLSMDSYVKRAPVGGLDVRVELDTSTVYVRCAAFNAWCAEHNITPNGLLSELALAEIYSPMQGTSKRPGSVQVRMGRGVATLNTQPAARAYRFVLTSEYELDQLAGQAEHQLPDNGIPAI